MKHKEARKFILGCLFIASVILAVFVHGPRLLAYVSVKTNYHSAKIESDYANVPITVGNVPLNALIANTEDKKILGLSYRESLNRDQSMLFVYDEPGIYGIWMKDMKFPIDIIWFDKNMRAVSIKKSVDPDTFPEVFEPSQEVSFVLETNAGFVDKNNITLGSELVLYH